MVFEKILTTFLGAVNDFLKGRRAEKKKESEENQVIKILQEQLDKSEERELQNQKEIDEYKNRVDEVNKQLNDLMRDLIRRKANGRH